MTQKAYTSNVSKTYELVFDHIDLVNILNDSNAVISSTPLSPNVEFIITFEREGKEVKNITMKGSDTLVVKFDKKEFNEIKEEFCDINVLPECYNSVQEWRDRTKLTYGSYIDCTSGLEVTVRPNPEVNPEGN